MGLCVAQVFKDTVQIYRDETKAHYVFYRLRNDLVPGYQRARHKLDVVSLARIKGFIEGLLRMQDHCHWQVTFLTYAEFLALGGRLINPVEIPNDDGNSSNDSVPAPCHQETMAQLAK
jgi:hypothetical protein